MIFLLPMLKSINVGSPLASNDFSPIPIWPSSFDPHVYTVPDFVNATTCLSPRLILSNSLPNFVISSLVKIWFKLFIKRSSSLQLTTVELWVLVKLIVLEDVSEFFGAPLTLNDLKSDLSIINFFEDSFEIEA